MAAAEEPAIHTPEEIARRLGGISVKRLAELVRGGGFEVTDLGLAQRSPKGGPRRRLWGMTDAQLNALLAARRERAS
jgi:hypothetical protein